MFGIGPTELIVILVIGLIVLGPERLPQVAGQIGKAIRDFRRMSDDVTSEFQRTINIEELTSAFNGETPPSVLTAETIEATSTPTGADTAYTFNLPPQVIPTELPDTAPPEAGVVEAAATASPAEDTLIATQAIATKADPHAGASFLDEPVPIDTAPARDEPYVYQPTAIPDQPPIDLNADPMPTTEASLVQAQNPIADAWDAVIATEATRSLPTPEEVTATEAESARPQIDPTAEVTIREVIEAQVAAEAFRERRRVASYRRTHKGA